VTSFSTASSFELWQHQSINDEMTEKNSDIPPEESTQP
jgi:hypothetical protein